MLPVGCEHPMSSRKNRISNIRAVFATHGRTKMTETERDIHKFPNLGLFNRRDSPHGTVRCRQCAAQSETQSTLKGLLENAHSLTLSSPEALAIFLLSSPSTSYGAGQDLFILHSFFADSRYHVRYTPFLCPYPPAPVGDLQGLVEVGSLPRITENVPRNMYNSEASRPRHLTLEIMRQ